MGKLPCSQELLDAALNKVGIKSMAVASIRETVAVIRYLEEKTGEKFVRMDMGIPGLQTSPVGVQGEMQALQKGKTAIYGQIDGIPELKHEAARFVKNFLDIETGEQSCLITTGAMMGGMISFMVAARREKNRQGVLFIDPGFPVQKKQARVMGLPSYSFDIYIEYVHDH